MCRLNKLKMVCILGERRLTVEDVLRISAIDEVRVSSRGDVALTIFRSDIEKNKTYTEIHVLRRDGSSAFLVGEGDSLPRWNPSGTLIAFSSRRGASEKEKGSGVFVWSGVGEPRKLAWFKHGISGLEWINDSQLIVNTPQPREELHDKDEDYVATEKLPLWFDGRGFVAGLSHTLYTLDVSSGYLKGIVSEEDGIQNFEICKDSIYYTTPVDWRNPTIHKLIKLDPVSREKKVILEGYSISSLKCVGGELYALMHKNEIGIASHYKLWLVQDDSVECLTCKILDRNIYVIAGEHSGGIVLTYSDSGSVLLASLKDGRLNVIAGEKAYVYTAHAEGGLVAYTIASPTKPQELYVYDGSEHKKLTEFNEWIPREITLYEPKYEKVKVKGEDVEGWVILPESRDKRPLILYIHGGPKGMYGYNFYPEMQLMVAEGFAVAYANPRGSDGYAEEFADIRGKYGEVDYEQLMAFLDKILENYPIDKSRLAVTGISYGGYMTNVIVTKTNRFKAAVSENGIADWIADYWASDIGYWFDPDQIGGTPHDNIEEYLKKSPAFHVDNVETPILLIHSNQDYRCFVDQSLAMHVSLVLRGKDSKLVNFTKGSHIHSMRAEPRHRKKRYEIKIKWLKEKLGVERE